MASSSETPNVLIYPLRPSHSILSSSSSIPTISNSILVIGNMADGIFFDDNTEMNHHRMSSTDLDYSSFNSSDCPSLSSSLSIEPPTPTASTVHRRPSLASSVSWEPGPSFSVSSLDTTGPSTPVRGESHSCSPVDTIMSDAHVVQMMDAFEAGYCFPLSEHTPSSSFDSNFTFHKPYDSLPYHHGEHMTMPLGTPSSSRSVQPFHYSVDGRSHVNPCLSRSIFASTIEASSESSNLLAWPSSSPQTMHPSEAFLEPVTPPQPYIASPMPLDICTPTPLRLKSSPAGLCSPLELKSQRRGSRIKKGVKKPGSLLNSLPEVVKSSDKFQCDVDGCRKKFKRAEHLKRHMRSHSTKRPFVCELCGRGFSRNDNKTAHYKTHANKSKGRNAYFEECDPQSMSFRFGGKAVEPKGKTSVRSKL